MANSPQYNVNQTKTLLALHKRNQMTKTQFSKRFVYLTIDDRYAALEQLLKDGLVIAEERPKSRAKHIPVYYFLSEVGKKWVAEYLNHT